jgi:hypothetical protein
MNDELVSPSLKRLGPDIPWFPANGNLILFCGGKMDGFLMSKEDWCLTMGGDELILDAQMGFSHHQLMGELARQLVGNEGERLNFIEQETYILQRACFGYSGGRNYAWFAIFMPLYLEANRDLCLIFLRQMHRWAQVTRFTLTRYEPDMEKDMRAYLKRQTPLT